jgi:hypothetical protein
MVVYVPQKLQLHLRGEGRVGVRIRLRAQGSGRASAALSVKEARVEGSGFGGCTDLHHHRAP